MRFESHVVSSRAVRIARKAAASALVGGLLTAASRLFLTVSCLWLTASGVAAAKDPAPGTASVEEAQVEASLIAIGQRIGADASLTGRRQRRLNARGDIEAAIPVLGTGGGRGSLVGHLRAGLGTGITTRSLYSGTVNGAGYHHGEPPDDRYAIVAQAYYQHRHPLGARPAGLGGGIAEGSHLAFDVGKFELFSFFSQLPVADQESEAFLNEALLHDPLLGTGGDAGGDDFGFSPGLRAAYFNGSSRRLGWGLSLGLFGAGEEAATRRLPRKPLVIVQAEATTRTSGGDELGAVRLYAWRNRLAEDFDGETAVHDGWGIVLNHWAGHGVTAFGRYSKRTRGAGFFGRAVTAGVAVSGLGWGREDDVAGIAMADLSTDSTYRSSTAAAAQREPGATWASGSERVLEVFYRFVVRKGIEVTPDFQYIRRPAGDPTRPAIRAFALRLRLTY